jgi:hypothetical protein
MLTTEQADRIRELLGTFATYKQGLELARTLGVEEFKDLPHNYQVRNRTLQRAIAETWLRDSMGVELYGEMLTRYRFLLMESFYECDLTAEERERVRAVGEKGFYAPLQHHHRKVVRHQRIGILLYWWDDVRGGNTPAYEKSGVLRKKVLDGRRVYGPCCTQFPIFRDGVQLHAPVRMTF